MKRLIALITPVVFLLAASTSKAQAEAGGLIGDFDALVQLLKTDDVQHKARPDDKLVMVGVKKGAIDGVMLIRWADRDGLVHFIQPMILKVPNERVANVESALLKMNHAMPVPGLNLNHKTGTVYFRMSVAIEPRGGISPDEVRMYFKHTLGQANELYATIQAVITEETQADTIVEYHNRKQQGTDAFPAGNYTRVVGGSTWILAFDTKGNVRVIRNNKQMVASTYSVRGSRILLQDKSGALATKALGIYMWSIQNGELQFKAIDDEAEGRTQILTTGAWKQAAPKVHTASQGE